MLMKKPVSHSKLDHAAWIIRSGGLVAFPTETVYGLGANALDAKAVSKIFAAKGRPADNPLIIHIANLSDANLLAKNISLKSQKLMKTFWPGPLTLVLKKNKIVPSITCANLDSVALRMPENKIALALIRKSGVPIAAPSANISGSPSPTTAKHVLSDFGKKIDLIIDGGSTKHGLESTVIDMTSKIPVLLRPGAITQNQIEKVIGKIFLHKSLLGSSDKLNSIKSPGMKYRHYAPKAKLIVYIGKSELVDKKIINDSLVSNQKIAVVSLGKKIVLSNKNKISISFKSKTEMAKKLFSTLRSLDDQKVDSIFVKGIDNSGIGLAIMNRLLRASCGNIVYCRK